MVHKICSICREAKPVTEFFPKRGKYEACCKLCKGKNRQIRAAKRGILEPPTSITPNSMGLNQAENQPDQPYIEPKQDLDFWDKKYGRPLSQEEQREIRFNLLALMSALQDAKVGV